MNCSPDNPQTLVNSRPSLTNARPPTSAPRDKPHPENPKNPANPDSDNPQTLVNSRPSLTNARPPTSAPRDKPHPDNPKNPANPDSDNPQTLVHLSQTLVQPHPHRETSCILKIQKIQQILIQTIYPTLVNARTSLANARPTTSAPRDKPHPENPKNPANPDSDNPPNTRKHSSNACKRSSNQSAPRDKPHPENPKNPANPDSDNPPNTRKRSRQQPPPSLAFTLTQAIIPAPSFHFVPISRRGKAFATAL